MEEQNGEISGWDVHKFWYCQLRRDFRFLSFSCLPAGRKTGIQVLQNQKLQKTRAIGVIPESIRGGIFSFENRVNEHSHRAVAGYCEEHKHAANEECDPMKSRVKKYSK